MSTVSPRKGVLERSKVLTVISATINTFIAKKHTKLVYSSINCRTARQVF